MSRIRGADVIADQVAPGAPAGVGTVQYHSLGTSRWAYEPIKDSEQVRKNLCHYTPLIENGADNERVSTDLISALHIIGQIDARPFLAMEIKSANEKHRDFIRAHIASRKLAPAQSFHSDEEARFHMVLGDILGCGGQGTVYADVSPNVRPSRYVIKILHNRKRSREEAMVHSYISRCRNVPNSMCRCKEYVELSNSEVPLGTSEGKDPSSPNVDPSRQLWLRISRVRGEAIRSVDGRNLTEDQILRYLSHHLEAIDFLHKKGIIHGDASANNLLIDQTSGQGYVIDLGLTKVIDPTAAARGTRLSGTIGYLPPEFLKVNPTEDHRPYVASTDIFAVGACYYELIYGITPLCFSAYVSFGASMPDGRGGFDEQKEKIKLLISSNMKTLLLDVSPRTVWSFFRLYLAQVFPESKLSTKQIISTMTPADKTLYNNLRLRFTREETFQIALQRWRAGPTLKKHKQFMIASSGFQRALSRFERNPRQFLFDDHGLSPQLKISDGLKEILLKMIHPNALERATAEEILFELNRLAANEASTYRSI